MANIKYYPEDELVLKVQSGEYGWLDYINHHSPEWQEEYTEFCNENQPKILSNGKANLLKQANNQHLKSITVCQSDPMHYQ